MAVWDELKVALLSLEGTGVLTQYPNLHSNEARQPPFEIHLSPWAVDDAADLPHRFGDNVNWSSARCSTPSASRGEFCPRPTPSRRWTQRR
jgi:hypothetical protein